MAMTIGRATGLRPRRIARSGDSLTVEGTIEAASAAELRMRWAQLRGLVRNADEPVVPVTWDVDSELDGFYAPISASVAPIGIEGGSRGRFSVSLERIAGGFVAPNIEVISGSIVRTNGHGITAPLTLVAARPGGSGYTAGYSYGPVLEAASVGAERTFITSDGLPALTSAYADGPIDITSYRLQLDAANAPIGRARVEVRRGGSWYEVVGRQAPVDDTSEPWRISNGIVRLTSCDPGVDNGKIERYDGGDWDASWDIRMLRNSTGWAIGGNEASNQNLARWAIVRNSPERVVVQSVWRDFVLNYTISRGAQHVEVSWSSDVDNSYAWGVDLDVACTAGSAFGIYQTTSPGSNFRALAAVAAAETVDTANGTVIPSSAAYSGSFCIGVASSTTSNDPRSPDPIMEQFIGTNPTLQRFVAR